MRAFYQRKFHYVLIDEYQDTNALQYRLSSLLAGGYENICVVGDDDQSIYKFRGATIENILSFEHQYKGAQGHPARAELPFDAGYLERGEHRHLEQQGPQGQKALDRKRRGREDQGLEAQNESDEGRTMSQARSSRASRGQNFKDYAILYRTNAQSNAPEYAFKRNGIPYRIIGGTRFFDRAEVRPCWHICASSTTARTISPAAHHQQSAARHRRENRRDGRSGRRTQRMCRSTRSSCTRSYPA